MLKANNKGWKEFLTWCTQVESQQQLDELLSLLLTLEEKEQLVTRVQLLQALLAAKQTQREIAADLHLSIAKITRGSNALKIISDKLRKYLLNRINNK